jgi:uncharacterized protein (DUF4415 family)
MQKSDNIIRKRANEIREDREIRGTDTDWQRVDSMTEAEIEHNGVDDQLENGSPDLEGPVWEGIPAPFGTGKKLMSVRIDNDVVEWFKSQGKGYQTHMNAVLRQYMEHHKAR